MMRGIRFALYLLLVTPAALCYPAAYAWAEEVRVRHVIDGDTLSVEVSGKQRTIRLIGIDAPESREDDKARKVSERTGRDLNSVIEMGRRATRFLASLVQPGDLLRVEYDVGREDRFGRLLGYLFLADGRMVNRVMVSEGFAQPSTFPPNVRYARDLRLDFDSARSRRAGLWRSGWEVMDPFRSQGVGQLPAPRRK